MFNHEYPGSFSTHIFQTHPLQVVMFQLKSSLILPRLEKQMSSTLHFSELKSTTRRFNSLTLLKPNTLFMAECSKILDSFHPLWHYNFWVG